MCHNLDKFFVWLCSLNILLLLLCLFLGNFRVICSHGQCNLLCIVVTLKHAVRDDLSVVSIFRKPLEYLLLFLQSIIDIILWIYNIFEGSVELGVRCFWDRLVLWVPLIWRTSRALAEGGAHLLVDTRLELFIEVSYWFENSSHILVHIIEFALISELAVVFDKIFATSCRCHQKATKDHKDNRNDQKNWDLDRNADAVLRESDTASKDDSNNWDGNHDAT